MIHLPKLIAFCGVMAFVGATAFDAKASLSVGDIVKLGDAPGSPGGIFYLQDANGQGITDTFCIQIEEYISFGEEYQVAGIGLQRAGATTSPLTSFAAWLYDRYLNGVEGVGSALSGFDFTNVYGTTNFADAQFQANQLQLAIWYAMGYDSGDIGSGFYDAYDGMIAGWENEWAADVASNAWSGTGDIYVLNLLGKDSAGEFTVDAQDQLIRIPNPSTGILPVPEPLSLLVWSVLGAGAAVVLRPKPATAIAR